MFWEEDRHNTRASAGYLGDDKGNQSSPSTDRIIPDLVSPEHHEQAFPTPPLADPLETELAQFHANIIGGYNFAREVYEAKQGNQRINPEALQHLRDCTWHLAQANHLLCGEAPYYA